MTANNNDVTDNRPSQPVLYTPAELTKILKVSLRTVRSWVRNGDLPHLRLGSGERLIRVRHEDLEKFLNHHYSGNENADNL